jgi:hypothetical protein
MSIIQIINAIIVYGWLFAVLWLIWHIWRISVTHIHHMETTMFNAAMKSAEAAKVAAEAARLLAEKKT